MATTTYQLVGNPTNTLPYDAQNGTVTAFNTTTGEGTFSPDTDFIGVASFQYIMLCDGVIGNIATITVPVTGAHCKKSVKLDIYCGSTPLTFKVKESLTNTELYVNHVKEGNRYCVYYNVPNDGDFHNLILGVFDSNGDLIATKQLLSKRCRDAVSTPTPPHVPRPHIGCHVEPLGTIVNWDEL